MNDSPCPFCRPDAIRIFHSGQLVLGLWDAFPLSPGHALLVPKRHVETWFEASGEERFELSQGITIARDVILREHQPDGFNVGINLGEAAGQTVPHLHVHVIPRYRGDVADPRGGVRHVIPLRGNYLVGEPQRISDQIAEYQRVSVGARGSEQSGLVQGGDDPLLPHIIRHLDEAVSVDLAVAFVLKSGVSLLKEHLRDALVRKGRIRLITGDYLDSTDPGALLELLDLREAHAEHMIVRVFETKGVSSFHPKAYIFRFKGGDGIAYVGSSNLTESALRTGIEWNYRIVPAADAKGFREIGLAFDALLAHPATREVDATWVDAYRRRRAAALAIPVPPPSEVADEPLEPPPRPHEVQREALAALQKTRLEGNRSGLVVLATGLGKTWLSAFDSQSEEFRRVLFVAHREEILAQAMATYRRIRPHASLGLYTGKEKKADSDVLFASIQTLGRTHHLEQFAPASFDYLVVDEFHHAWARTYRQLLDHFEPRFLLALTATPERTDGGDLLALCDENLVYRCDLVEGIRRGLLSPFRYFGVPDEVDYTNIPWRSSRFDEEALASAVATRSRADNALEQHRKHGGTRTLAFCCSTRHADFMAEHFRAAGIAAVAVHSGAESAPRATSLERLERGELQVVFAVDMLNEGVDLPDVDTILMLRPTESRIVWLQQFGRGLRKAEGKERLRVVDYIGNHRSFLLKPQTLFDLSGGDGEIRDALDRYQRGDLDLPPGCEVTYELEAIKLLRGLLRLSKGVEEVRSYYMDFRERHGRRPLAVEAYHDGHRPDGIRKQHGSWLRFVEAMGDFSKEASILLQGATGEFLDELEKTHMTRSFKMLVVLAMLNADAIPGAIAIDSLVDGFSRIATRSMRLREDVGSALDDTRALRTLIEKNPIDAWIGGRGTGGVAYFEYRDGSLRFTPEVAPELRTPLQELIREIADWRLAQYLDRPTARPTNLVKGKAYARRDVIEAFHLPDNPSTSQSGFICVDQCIVLFVTLEKEKHPQQHRYDDRFLGRDQFRWQSQNQTTQQGKNGEAIRQHRERNVPVHLFVRRQAKEDQRAAPFFYCGELEFVSWEGERPITVLWRLRTPLSDALGGELGVA